MEVARAAAREIAEAMAQRKARGIAVRVRPPPGGAGARSGDGGGRDCLEHEEDETKQAQQGSTSPRTLEGSPRIQRGGYEIIRHK